MFDGTLTIDTALNTKGFDKGILSLISGLKNLALTASSVILGILGVQSVKSVALLSAEFGRLKQAAQAIGQMYGFTAAKSREMIDSLVAQGVQTDVASRAYINFVKEGLDANLLPGLAAGAQNLNALAESGESSSDVLNTLMNGILTLNTQVLRNRGVVVDLAEAYRNYAKDMGLSAGALSVTQQRQALLIAVTEKLRGVSGLYELSQRTAAGQMSSNIRIMKEFKNVLGGAFQDALYNIIKSFNDLIKALTKAFKEGGRLYHIWLALATVATLLSRVIRVLFETMAKWLGLQTSNTQAVTDTSGGLEDLVDSADDATVAELELGDAIEEATEKASGALASFDKLNVLQKQSADGIDIGTGDIGLPTDLPIVDLEDLQDVDLSQIEDPLKRIQEAADALWLKFKDLFAPLIEGLEKLKEALLPLGKTIWAGLLWAWENILVPFGSWVMSKVVPLFLELLAAGARFLNTALIALQPLGKWLWEKLLKPLAEWTGGMIITILEWLVEKLDALTAWVEANPEKFQAIVTVIMILIGAFYLVQGAIAAFAFIMGVAEAAAAVFGIIIGFLTSPILIVIAAILLMIGMIALWVWEFKTALTIIKQLWFLLSVYAGIIADEVWTAFMNAFDKIKEFAQAALQTVVELFTDMSGWFERYVTDPLVSIFRNTWNTVEDLTRAAWSVIQNIFGAISGWLSRSVSDPIREAFGQALDWVGEKWRSVFDGIVGFVRGVINSIIGILNGLLEGAVIGINAMIDGANLFGMTTVGWSVIPNIGAPQIPYLAQGAVIPPNAQFAAMLGDNTRENEILAPESTIRRILKEELLSSGGEITVNMPVYLDSEKIYDGQKKVQTRRGGSLVKNGVGI